MKKTVFVGMVNDQQFTNVEDYNACVKAMIDKGEPFQATTSTQVIEEPDECNETCEAKPLKALPQYTPAYEDRNDGVYIDKVLDENDEVFETNINNLEKNLREIYNFVSEAIPHSDNTPDHLRVYGEAVNEMINILNRDLEKTRKSQDTIQSRINELEDELNVLYDTANHLDKAEEVINMYNEFYDAVNGLLVQHEADTCPGCTCCEDTCKCDEVTDEQIAEVTQKLTTSFAKLLREIFSK
jgi:predicted nucleic acid-binding protein